MGNGYLPTAPKKSSSPPARQSAVCGEDVIYISICSGGAIIKISAADRSKFVLGQLIILGAIFVVTLVELTLWQIKCQRGGRVASDASPGALPFMHYGLGAVGRGSRLGGSAQGFALPFRLLARLA
jgi:hypothetical protein